MSGKQQKNDVLNLRILSVNKFYYLFGGSERVLFETNLLLKNKGAEIIPFSMHHPENYKTEYQKYFVKEIDYNNLFNWKKKFEAIGRIFYSKEANIKLSRLIKRFNPEIAHLHLVYHQLPISIVSVIKNAGIPIVHTLHDYKVLCPVYSFISNNTVCERCKTKKFYHVLLHKCNKNSLLFSTLNCLEMYFHYIKRYYQMSDIYITPSNFMRNKMIEYGWPESKFVHIPNFIDYKNYPYQRKYKPYIVYVGRLFEIKGVHTLLHAMNLIKELKIDLLIIGDGPERIRLEEMKKDLNLSNVQFLGYLGLKKFSSYVSSCLFSVLPSIVYENCPMTVLESMAMGKAVLGANIGGIPELINSGIDGMLFKPGDAHDLANKIKYLVQNKDLTIQMGQKGRQKIIEQYNPDQYFKKLNNVYQSVMRRG